VQESGRWRAAFNSLLYTVDVPLPFIDFGHSKWVAVGVAQTVTVVLVLLGWVLAPRGDCRVRRRTAPWGLNGTGPNHNANAAAHSYDRVVDWFGRFVDRGGQGG
jgi:hypothetical protein